MRRRVKVHGGTNTVGQQEEHIVWLCRAKNDLLVLGQVDICIKQDKLLPAGTADIAGRIDRDVVAHDVGLFDNRVGVGDRAQNADRDTVQQLFFGPDLDRPFDARLFFSCQAAHEIGIKDIGVGRNGGHANGVFAAGHTPACMQHTVLIRAGVHLRRDCRRHIGGQVRSGQAKRGAFISEERRVICSFLIGQLITGGACYQSSMIGPLTFAPRPIGLVFAGLAIAERVLDVFNLVERTLAFGQPQVTPEPIYQSLTRAFVFDLRGIGIDQITAFHTNQDITACNDLIKAQITGNFNDRDIVVRGCFQAVGCICSCVNTHGCSGSADAAASLQRHRSACYQTAAITGKDGPCRCQRCVIAAACGHDVDCNIPGELLDVDVACRGRDIDIPAQHLRLIDRQRHKISTHTQHCVQRNHLAADECAGSQAFAGDRGDCLVRRDRRRAGVILDRPDDDNRRISANDVDRRFVIAEEIQRNRVIRLDGVCKDGRCPRGLLMDVGEGCLAIPGCTGIRVVQIDASVAISDSDGRFVDIRLTDVARIQLEEVRILNQLI